MENPSLFLASKSPRRRDLLAQIGVRFGVLDIDLNEDRLPGEAPESYVLRLALDKARAGRSLVESQNSLPVLAADTAVVIDDRLLGKPRDRADAASMMRLLAGRTHRVLSGIALVGTREQQDLSVSEVRFRAVSMPEADAYWESGEPRDKAGGYAIQGLGALFVADLRGSYSGVMGLPLFETARLLAEEGIRCLIDAPTSSDKYKRKKRLSEEILVNVTPPETRVAVVENGAVQEIIIERADRCGLVGNVYRGRICRVLPGMQAAFVDIGLERAAFLHTSDIVGAEGEPRSEHITEVISEGDMLTVQVVKDPLGTKGARLTTNISIPSRYLVFMPALGTTGVSQKIEDEEERKRLRDIMQGFVDSYGVEGGFIARTAAESIAGEALIKDMDFLAKLWLGIEERCRSASEIGMIHDDLPLALRALRDLVGPEVERVRIDSRSTFEQARIFADKYLPDITAPVEHYQGERPLFDLYGVDDEIQKALQRKVQLKSGGHLIIDQTEAMTTIDVNTGAFVGHRNLEETIFKTNLEAAQAICRQLRLRNLGGIIIIDFIDMCDDEHKRQVLRALEKCLAKDHAKTHITEVSSLGLVEMTRKRTRESLEHILCEPCTCCGGRGTLKTAETTCYEIFREILREARQFDVETLLVLASQEVIDRLLDEESGHLAELEELTGKPIRLQAEALYTQEQYDVVLI